MARYYFNFFDGEVHRDTVGTVLSGLSEARVQAIGLLGEMLRRDPDRFQSSDDWRIEMTDDRGLILFIVGAVCEMVQAPLH